MRIACATLNLNLTTDCCASCCRTLALWPLICHKCLSLYQPLPCMCAKRQSSLETEKDLKLHVCLPSSLFSHICFSAAPEPAVKYGSTMFISPHPQPSSSSSLCRVAPFFPPEEISVSSMKYNLTLNLPHSLSHCLYHSPHHHLM